MKNPPNGKSVRTLAVFSLAGLYFVLAIGVTLLGSGTYRSVAAAADQRYTQRTALSYVVNQVRRGGEEVVAVGDFGGCSALRLLETTPDGSVYATYIYCYEGQLRELYTELGSGLLPADGMGLAALASLDFSTNQGLITVTAGDGERTWSVKLFPQAGVEEVGHL